MSTALLGGAAGLAEPVCAAIAAFALVIAGSPRFATRDPLVRAFILMSVVSILQLVPLPVSVASVFSHIAGDLHEAAGRHTGASSLIPIHLDPGNGWSHLTYLLGLFAAYLASCKIGMSGLEDRLVASVRWVTFATAGIALMHKAIGMESLFGVYVPREAAPTLLAPLLNQNHLAAFTGVGFLLWLGYFHSNRETAAVFRFARIGAALTCGIACALAGSRGGFAFAAAGTLPVLLPHRVSERENKVRAASIATLAAAGILGALIYAAWPVLEHEYSQDSHGKLHLIASASRMVRHGWIMGFGHGGLYAALASQGHYGSSTVMYAECLPVDLVLSFGLIPGIVVLGLLAAWLRRHWLRRPEAAETWTATVALLSLAVHDFFDFSLALGANGYIAVVLAGSIASRRFALQSEGLRRQRSVQVRIAALVGATAVAAAAPILARSTLVADRDRAIAASRAGVLEWGALVAAMRRHPGDAYLPLLGASTWMSSGGTRVLALLNRSMRVAPGWAAPHTTLAVALARRGMRSQALVELSLGLTKHATLTYSILSVADLLDLSSEELRRIAHLGGSAFEFLDLCGSRALPEVAVRCDQAILEQRPDSAATLSRMAARAAARHDDAGEQAAWDRVVRVAPQSPEGYLGLARIQGRRGDHEGAIRTLTMGLSRVSSRVSLYQQLAMERVALRDTSGMRAAIDELLNQPLSIEERISAIGTHAQAELELGHQAAALTAFEQAEHLSYPQHPYALQIAQIASSLGDDGRVRQLCWTLEDPAISGSLRTLCATAEQGTHAARSADSASGAPVSP